MGKGKIRRPASTTTAGSWSSGLLRRSLDHEVREPNWGTCPPAPVTHQAADLSCSRGTSAYQCICHVHAAKGCPTPYAVGLWKPSCALVAPRRLAELA